MMNSKLHLKSAILLPIGQNISVNLHDFLAIIADLVFQFQSSFRFLPNKYTNPLCLVKQIIKQRNFYTHVTITFKISSQDLHICCLSLNSMIYEEREAIISSHACTLIAMKIVFSRRIDPC